MGKDSMCNSTHLIVLTFEKRNAAFGHTGILRDLDFHMLSPSALKRIEDR